MHNNAQNELAAKLSIALTEWRTKLEAVRARHLIIGGLAAKEFSSRMKECYFCQMDEDCPIYRKFSLAASVETIIIWPNGEREIEWIGWLYEWENVLMEVCVPIYIVFPENPALAVGK